MEKDLLNLTTLIQRPNGAITTMTYDAFGRLLTTTNPLNRATTPRPHSESIASVLPSQVAPYCVSGAFIRILVESPSSVMLYSEAC